MAKKRDTSEYDYKQSLNQPALRLRNYKGPYDRSALQRACDELLYHVERTRNTAVWRSIQMKTQVNVLNGVRNSDDGFGETSNIYSHSGPVNNDEIDESCQNTDSNDSETITVTAEIQEKPGTSFTQSKDESKLKILNDDDSCYDNEKDTKIITVKFKEKEGKGKIDHENITKLKMMESESDNKNTTVVTQDPNVCVSDESVNETSKGANKEISLHPSVTQTLKCDHCDFRSIDINSIREHLLSAVHYSASRYDIDNGEVILKEEMIAKNEKARFKTIVMKCPVNTCCAIFPKMKECITHYNDKHWKHGNLKNQFALVDVVNDDECSIKIKPFKCNLCILTFRTRGSLKRHLEEKHLSNCSPSKSKNTFLCGYCEKSFPWLDIVISHVKKHKPLSNAVFKLTAFQLDNVRKFNVSSSGRIERLNGTEDVTSNLGKRTHDQVYSDNEPNIKVSRKMDCESTEVVIELDGETGHEPVAMCEEEVARQEQNPAYSDSHDSLSTAIPVKKLKCSNKDLSIQTANDSQKDSLKHSFSCDYCLVVTDLEKEMISHLQEKFHASASRVVIDSDKNIKYIKGLSNIVGVDSCDQKAYAICPEDCKVLFSSVKCNIEHYILCHARTEFKPCYGIVEVIDEVVLTLFVDKCIMCGESFRKTKHLLSHCKRKHYPFPLKDGCDLFFKCSPCKKTFTSFDKTLSHAKKHLDLTKESQFEISVLYLERKIRKCELYTKLCNDTKEHDEEIQNLRATIHKIESTSKALLQKHVRVDMKKTAKNAKDRLLRIIT